MVLVDLQNFINEYHLIGWGIVGLVTATIIMLFFKDARKWIKNNNELIVILFLVVASIFAYLELRQNERDTKDMYLTGVWNDIMKKSIEHPEFNDKSKTLVYNEAFQGDQKRRYGVYVRWIGGFIEDLHIKHYKEEGWLYYEPWIESVLDTHKTWFIDNIHYYKYTEEFYGKLSDIKKKEAKKNK